MKPVFTCKNQVTASANRLWETRIDPKIVQRSLKRPEEDTACSSEARGDEEAHRTSTEPYAHTRSEKGTPFESPDHARASLFRGGDRAQTEEGLRSRTWVAPMHACDSPAPEEMPPVAGSQTATQGLAEPMQPQRSDLGPAWEASRPFPIVRVNGGEVEPSAGVFAALEHSSRVLLRSRQARGPYRQEHRDEQRHRSSPRRSRRDDHHPRSWQASISDLRCDRSARDGLPSDVTLAADELRLSIGNHLGRV